MGLENLLPGHRYPALPKTTFSRAMLSWRIASLEGSLLSSRMLSAGVCVLLSAEAGGSLTPVCILGFHWPW